MGTGLNTNRHWQVRYNKVLIEVLEESGPFIFIATSEIRKVLPKFRVDRALQKHYGRAIAQKDKTQRLYITEGALSKELQGMAAAEATMFLTWLYQNVFSPAARRRGEVVGRADLLATSEVVPPDRPIARTYRSTKNDGVVYAWFAMPFVQHWRGEEALGRTMVGGLIAACIAVLFLEKGFGWLANEDSYHGDWQFRKAVTLGFVISLFLVWLWWGVGAMRCALNRVSENKSVTIAGTVFLTGLLFMIQSGAKALEDSRDWIQDFYHPLRAADVYYDNQSKRIVLHGDIGFGTYNRLQRAISERPEAKLLELDSHGGYAIEGFAMATLIERSQLSTVTFRDCDSACTLLLVAGRKRLLGPEAAVGFHRSYVPGMIWSDSWSHTDFKIARYLEKRGAHQDFINTALSYRGDNIWHPKHRQMLDSGYATGKWGE